MRAWLKSLGAAGRKMSDDWTQNPRDAANLNGVDFPIVPRSIDIGDRLVLYAPGHRRVFGVAEVVSDFYRADRHPRWPIRCDVRVLLAVPRLSDAPELEELVVRNGRDLMLSVRQQPYVELKPPEYVRAVNTITASALTW